MIKTIRFYALTLVVSMLVLIGCGMGDQSPKTLEGAWLGTGEFNSSHGTQQMKAQLELLSHGTYRLLILEPKVLMMAGVEKGQWKENGSKLDLTPVKEEPTKPTGNKVLDVMKAPKDFRPKTLEIQGKYKALKLSDGKLDLEFAPNPKVTEKLKQAGDVE